LKNIGPAKSVGNISRFVVLSFWFLCCSGAMGDERPRFPLTDMTAASAKIGEFAVRVCSPRYVDFQAKGKTHEKFVCFLVGENEQEYITGQILGWGKMKKRLPKHYRNLPAVHHGS
jgi:hypothetical protein